MYFENPFLGAPVRIKIFPVVLIAGLAVLGGAVHRTQVYHGAEYRNRLERQSARGIRLPAVRGKIYDRHRICLADNRPDYRIGLYPEELRRAGSLDHTVDAVLRTADEIGDLIGNPTDLDRETIRTHLQRRQPLMLVGWHDLDPQSLAAFAERAPGVPGADIDVHPRRVYPCGASAAHLLGSVGRADDSASDSRRHFHFYIPGIEGKSGVERSMERVLKGVPGGQLVRVDVSGYKYEEIGAQTAVPGNHCVLALDLAVQEVVEGVLSGYSGAAVVIDPRNGDVLALASSPGFDPNDLVSPVDRATWSRLSGDLRHPLVNRAVSGLYMPGSTFKPIVALAGLAAGSFDTRTRVTCTGSYRVGRKPFRCWYAPGHGPLAVRGALRNSCNVFFYDQGVKLGAESIEAMARAFGLGEPSGIDLPGEAGGIVRRRPGEPVEWYDGDTANLSIGQGRIAVTPLQMANAAATLANGGTLYRPRLVLRVEGRDGRVIESFPVRVRRRLDIPADLFQTVRLGMFDVVEDLHGTGRNAHVPGIRIAGKTGTAQRASDSREKDTWFIGFAPFEEPRYALAIVVEKGDSGGRTAAPLAGRIFAALCGATPVEGGVR